jgi:glucose-1-phosphate thymidylyltransferase
MASETHGEHQMKGILLAGGSGTRLYPLTLATSKQLLPVYNKPMIYYPLSVLMLAGIRQILVIGDPQTLPQFQRLLGHGEQWGIRFFYKEQQQPRGLADAFVLGRDFVADEPSSLILGDNILYGTGLWDVLRNASLLKSGAHIFSYPVRNPEAYGVVEFDGDGRVIGIEEKPKKPRSRNAIPGLYFYDSQVCAIASTLRPSSRGELEITDVNRTYLEMDELVVEPLGRGVAWLDAGTPDNLLQAANFVQTIEERQGMLIGSPEEVAYRMKYIDEKNLGQLIKKLPHGHYREYLAQLLEV